MRPPVRRRVAVAAAALAVVLVVIGFAAGTSERHRLDRAGREETATRRALRLAHVSQAGQRRQLQAAYDTTAQLARDVADGRYDAARTSSQLTLAQALLTSARSTLSSQATRRDALHRCLGGVHAALDRTRVGDTAGATGFLRGAAPACQTALTSPGDPVPVLAFDFADPFVVRVGSSYYAYATNAAGGSVQLARGSDLTNFEFAGNALAALPAWAAPGTVWAPSVLVGSHGAILYYTVREAFTGRQCLSLAYAAGPAGPFLDPSTGPLECGTTGAIDPSPFVDGSGAPFLLYKTEGPARIWSRPLTPDGHGFAGAPSLLLAPSQRWEAGNVEAPSMLRAGSAYWLFYSGNNWNSRQYAEGAARCDGPSGPCHANPANPVLASKGVIAGPGGGEVFTDGSSPWLAYHAYREPLVGYPNSRLMYFGRIGFDASGRATVTP
jgi:hypothetical protein